MKELGEKGTDLTHDCSSSSTSSASHPKIFRLGAMDLFVLSVLFLEAAVLVRLFMAG